MLTDAGARQWWGTALPQTALDRQTEQPRVTGIESIDTQTREEQPMQRRVWCSALALALVAAVPASVEIFRGVMAIKGAEMS